jgi:hypothetical protein
MKSNCLVRGSYPTVGIGDPRSVGCMLFLRNIICYLRIGAMYAGMGDGLWWLEIGDAKPRSAAGTFRPSDDRRDVCCADKSYHMIQPRD